MVELSKARVLLGLRVRIPSGTWMSACCKCCVLSERGLCDGPITRLEESYWLWCVTMYDLETSRRSRHWLALGFCARKKTVQASVLLECGFASLGNWLSAFPDLILKGRKVLLDLWTPKDEFTICLKSQAPKTQRQDVTSQQNGASSISFRINYKDIQWTKTEAICRRSLPTVLQNTMFPKIESDWQPAHCWFMVLWLF